MNMLFLFLYIVNGLMAPTTYGANIDFKTKKPIICTYWGNKIDFTRPETPITDPNTIPEECEVILMSGFTMFLNSTSQATEEYLEPILKLNRTVLLEVGRENAYAGVSTILKSDGNEKDAKVITDYATSKGIAGVILINVTPEEDSDIADGSVAKNIIPYLRQLKINNDFIVGITINPYHENLLLDPCVLDFEAMDSLVDLYVVDTFRMHRFCEAELFNGLTPIKSTNDVVGLDSVITEIGKSKIAVDKIYLIISLVVVDPNEAEYLTHSEICVTTKDTTKWCAPTIKDYYEKGKYIHEQNFGIQISWIELDDVNNSCGCCPFIAVINIAAGYKDEQQISCAKFDVKDNAP